MCTTQIVTNLHSHKRAQINDRGGLLLITARFIPGGRTAVTIASGITRQSRDVSLSIMRKRSADRLGPLQGALDALIDDIEQRRDLPAND